MKNVTISLCMIVKNEEEVLGRCLSTVADFTDEIIIVDTGSTDRTKEIAREYTDKIYDFEWVDDFSKARNYSFSKATQNYIMWLDADDIVPKKSGLLILELKKRLMNMPDIACIITDYQTTFDSHGHLISTLRRERIVKRECGFQWIGIVHEMLNVSGETLITDIKIKHMKNKTPSSQYIKIYEQAVKQGKELTNRDKFQYANECVKHKQYKKAMRFYEEITSVSLNSHSFRYRLKNEGSNIPTEKVSAYLKLSECHIQFNELDEAIASCLKIFQLDSPKAEVCCRLGYIYQLKKEIYKAVGWYKLASNIEIPVNSSFIKEPCYTWLPHLRLSACYLLLGDVVEAKLQHDMAAKYVPNSPYVKENEQILKEIQSQEEENGL